MLGFSGTSTLPSKISFLADSTCFLASSLKKPSVKSTPPSLRPYTKCLPPGNLPSAAFWEISATAAPTPLSVEQRVKFASLPSLVLKAPSACWSLSTPITQTCLSFN